MVAIRSADARDASGVALMNAVVTAGRNWATCLRELVHLVAKLDRTVTWVTSDIPSCAHWLAEALDIEVSTAREWLRVGRALTKLPTIDAAFDDGSLSYSKVRTLTRVATEANEVELCAMARSVPANRLRHALAAWLMQREKPKDTAERHRKARYFSWRTDVDGMIVGSFRLPPVSGAQITTPVDALVRTTRTREPDASADAPPGWHVRWPTIGQQRADALVELVRGGGASTATEIIVHVRADGCSLDDGTPVADSVVERIAPHAFLRALIHDAESRPINASGRQRHPTQRQQRVVKSRDQVCVDCGSTDFLQYDHDPPYEESHRTIVDELYCRCWPCHRARHRRAKRQS